jgi:hypothetical protein
MIIKDPNNLTKEELLHTLLLDLVSHIQRNNAELVIILLDEWNKNMEDNLYKPAGFTREDRIVMFAYFLLKSIEVPAESPATTPEGMPVH